MAEMEWRFGDWKGCPVRISRSASRFCLLQGVLCPWWQQSSSHEVQIGQREQRQCPDRVLVQPAVANLGKAPQALDHVEGELAAGAATRTAAVDRLLVVTERLMRFGAAVDPIANAGLVAVLAVILAPIGLVAIELVLRTVQQIIQPRDIRFLRRPSDQAMHQPLLAGPDMHLHPEVPLLVLL